MPSVLYTAKVFSFLFVLGVLVVLAVIGLKFPLSAFRIPLCFKRVLGLQNWQSAIGNWKCFSLSLTRFLSLPALLNFLGQLMAQVDGGHFDETVGQRREADRQHHPGQDRQPE